VRGQTWAITRVCLVANLLHITAVLARTIFEGTWAEPENVYFSSAILPSEIAALILHMYPKYMEVRCSAVLPCPHPLLLR